MNDWIPSIRQAVLFVAACGCAVAGLACGGALRGSAAAAPDGAPARRAILVSFDSFSEARMMSSLPPASIPAIRRLFSRGACAAWARPAFPSLTAPGHASLWTGAYGNVTGIAANDQPRLPRDQHSLLERVSGFSFAALRAEPIWLTAARANVRVVGHHVTQAPGPPGYPAISGPPDDSLLARRAAAIRATRLPGLAVLNGYNRRLANDTVLTERQAPPRRARGWRNLDRLHSGVPPLEIAWMTGADSIYALLHGARTYDRIHVARARDAAQGVSAPAAPPDTSPSPGRPLARYFSAPLPLSVEGGVAHAVVRLFALAPDASQFELFIPEVNVVEANRPDVAAAYGAAVGGWTGNAAGRLLARGGFGRPLAAGGDGSAEWRWLEAAEYMTRQSIAGAAWAWRARGAMLLLDYFPLGDETDHMMFGIVAPDAPPQDSALVRATNRVRSRAWQLVDRRLAELQRLVEGDSSALLLVSGDHGMRPTWRVFRPNVALALAGLLALDSGGAPLLERTRALSPNGYFISVNSADRRGGIVPADSVAYTTVAVIDALRQVTGADGERVVLGAWATAGLDSLGAGGPAGGDVYFDLLPGYRASWEMRGAVTGPAALSAGHGFLSTAPDMRTVLCAYGDAVPAHRTSPARTIDAAPTVAEWLGMPAPADSRGRSRLRDLLPR